MTKWDLVLTGGHAATLRDDEAGYGEIEAAAIAVSDGKIAWIGPEKDLPRADATETRLLSGRWVTPALIDCHTHIVFGGNRALEFEQRLGGASYEEIAAAGGGILSTVKATRDASPDELLQAALPRAQALRAEGVGTIEIKTGYGLDVDNELKMLEVARWLGDASGLDVRKTLLAAHTVPPEFSGRPDDYIEMITDELLPQVANARLADAVDAYCESIAFSAPQIAKLFREAKELGLPVKLHADQLSDGGGAELAAFFEALSADHLEYTSATGVKAMAKAGTVAVLLPGAFLTLGETQLPPVAALRDNGVPIAVGSDCNPGTSPVYSLRMAMILGSRLFGLTPLECLAGVTREAARALGLLSDRGTLEIGKRADIAIWDIGHPRELTYSMGTPQLSELLLADSI